MRTYARMGEDEERLRRLRVRQYIDLELTL